MAVKKFKEKESYNSFFIKSEGTWKACKKPKRKPDYVSYRRNFVELKQNIKESEIFHHISARQKENYTHHFFWRSSHFWLTDYDCWRIYYTDKRLGISSRYWYGEDKKGKYIVRESDHWGSVGKCYWEITNDTKTRKIKCGKIYL